MKSSEDFKLFYRNTLAPAVAALEAERKKLTQKVYLFIASTVAAFVISIAISAFSDKSSKDDAVPQTLYANQGGPSQVTNSGNGGTNVVFLFILGGGLGYYFWFRPKKAELKSRFKTEVIGTMVKFIDESLQLNSSSGISRSEYEQSKIFLSSGDRYMCEDLVSGKIGNTAIRFSEVHTQKKQSGGNSENSNWITLFKGILFVADFNKHFNGRTVVLTDKAEKIFGSIGTMLQKMNIVRDPLIKLENIEFEKAFAVYSTDAVEAHYILSPSLMESILNFRNKSGKKIEMSFVDSNVFVSIPIEENLFEARIFSSLANYSRLEKYNGYLQLIAGIVEDLKLNNRIWTKQ